MSRLSRVAMQFRAAIANQEEDAATALVVRYATVYDTLSRALDDVTQQIVDMQGRGEEISRNAIYQRTRISTLLSQIKRQIEDFSAFAEPHIVAQQLAAISLAEEHAAAMVKTAFGPIPNGVKLPQNFLRFDPRVVQSFVGRASNGSPLADLFAGLTDEPIKAVEDVFIKGIIAGENPRTVARALKVEFDVPKTRALTISRTEVLQAYRATNLEYYQQNETVVLRWRWQCAFNARTCAMCLAMDGREFDTQIDMGTHPNCRCVLVPVVRPLSELGFHGIKDRRPTAGKTGSDWFAEQDEKTQRSILGNAKFGRYNAGDLTLRDLVGIRDDPEWGVNRWERSIKQVDAGTYAPTGADWGILPSESGSGG